MNNTFSQFLIITVCIFVWSGCVMDYVDSISLKNTSKFKIDVLVNENYPDTTLSRASLLKKTIDPTEEGPLDVVNKQWEEYLKEEGNVTLFFVEWKPLEFYRSGRASSQKVYGKLVLSQAKLDSLGGKISFPEDVE